MVYDNNFHNDILTRYCYEEPLSVESWINLTKEAFFDPLITYYDSLVRTQTVETDIRKVLKLIKQCYRCKYQTKRLYVCITDEQLNDAEEIYRITAHTKIITKNHFLILANSYLNMMYEIIKYLGSTIDVNYFDGLLYMNVVFPNNMTYEMPSSIATRIKYYIPTLASTPSRESRQLLKPKPKTNGVKFNTHLLHKKRRCTPCSFFFKLGICDFESRFGKKCTFCHHSDHN
jgi:hypothetical protein